LEFAVVTTGNPYPQQLAQLVDEARSIEVAALDGAGLSEVRGLVIPALVRILEEAIATVTRLEGELGTTSGEALSPIDLPPRKDVAGLLDLCCVVRGELEHRRAAFNRLGDDGDLWAHLEALEWAQHELIRGLCAVESQLAHALGIVPATGRVDLVAESLVVRELAAGLRGDLADISEQGANGLARSLEAAGESLVRLTERTGFGRLRALDRRMARQLHHRIAVWLEHPAPDPEDGTHLWQEVRNFSVLLHDVSRRSELLTHDLAVLDEVIDLLAGVNPQEPPPGRVLDRLHRLLGLDDELDSLVRTRARSRGIERRVQHLYESLRSRWSIDSERDPLRELAAQA
jgi:hypothetical protein